MIGHVNLLDRVYYCHNGRVDEVTIVSKMYETTEDDGWRNKYKAVNIVFNDEVIAVYCKNLYYTNKEAYEELLTDIEKEIFVEEESIQKTQSLLAQLNNTRNNILNKLDNINESD